MKSPFIVGPWPLRFEDETLIYVVLLLTRVIKHWFVLLHLLEGPSINFFRVLGMKHCLFCVCHQKY